MKKLLLVAALAGGMFSAAPIATAQAASMPLKCLFFTLLQPDCVEMIHDSMTAAHDAAAASAKAASAPVVAGESKVMDALTRFPTGPWWWTKCEKAPEGSNFLLVCG